MSRRGGCAAVQVALACMAAWSKLAPPPRTSPPPCRRRDEILRHIQPGAVKLLIYLGQPQPGGGELHDGAPAAALCPAACTHPSQLHSSTPWFKGNKGRLCLAGAVSARCGSRCLAKLPCASPPLSGAFARPVTAAELASADVVLTTYDILRKDMHRCPDAGEAGGRTLRFRKKYEARLRVCRQSLVWDAGLCSAPCK